VFNEREALSNQFLLHLLSSSDVVAHANAASSGVNLPRVAGKKLGEFRLGLPPPPEQNRIVARIEALLAKLDDGVTELKRAETNLERYRASVLKAAVEGRLTEQWRSGNPPDETGEELLRRILGERRKRWEEEQLAAFAAKGRKPPRNWQTKYREPVAPDTAELPALPEGWCLGHGRPGGASDRRPDEEPGPWRDSDPVPLPPRRECLRGPLEAGRRENHRRCRIGVEARPSPRGRPPGCGGQRERRQIGRVAEWRGELTTCCHQNHLIKVRCDHDRACLPRWLLLWLLSPLGRRRVLDKASSTSGLYTLSLSKVRALPFPLAPSMAASSPRTRTTSPRASSWTASAPRAKGKSRGPAAPVFATGGWPKPPATRGARLPAL